MSAIRAAPQARGCLRAVIRRGRAGTPLRALSRRNPHGHDRPGRDNPLITRAGVSGRDEETSARTRPAGALRHLYLVMTSRQAETVRLS